MKDDSIYLQHILDAIAKIETYTATGREAFEHFPMEQDVVIRALRSSAKRRNA